MLESSAPKVEEENNSNVAEEEKIEDQIEEKRQGRKKGGKRTNSPASPAPVSISITSNVTAEKGT